MSDDDKLPPIDVNMGDNNTVGHIGHKITYQAPPPPPNAIYQNGNVVGVFEGEPQVAGCQYRFPALIFSAPFDKGAAIEIQGIRLLILRSDIETSANFVGLSRTAFQNATCQVLT